MANKKRKHSEIYIISKTHGTFCEVQVQFTENMGLAKAGAWLKQCVCFSLIIYVHEVIPEKLKLPMNFFETFPECSLPSTVLKNTIKMIGRHSCLRDVMANHTQFMALLVLITCVIHQSK